MDSPFTPSTSSYQIPSSFNPNTPPPPPPKRSGHATSQTATLEGGPPLPLPPPPPHDSRQSFQDLNRRNHQSQDATGNPPLQISLPEDGWLPYNLRDKSYGLSTSVHGLILPLTSIVPRKTELSNVLSSTDLQAALVNAPSTTHPSVPQSQKPLHTALQQNIALAAQLNSLESQLDVQRATTQSQLLSLHALERQWRQKQAEMDTALSPFSPKSLYQRLAQAVQEQEQVCQALEESFLEGDGRAGEREVGDFVKRYREGKKLMLLRRERKERWDEGRVGGWR